MSLKQLLLILILSQLYVTAHSDAVTSGAPPCSPVPKVTHAEIPDYPRLKSKDQVMQVIIEVTIDTNGRATDAIVIESSDASFDTPALRAARKWRFEPPAQACKARIPMAQRAATG